MLKVLIVGDESERILEASKFFRDRDIEVLYMFHPSLDQLEQYLKEGIEGILICDSVQYEMWLAWLRRNKCHDIVIH